MKYTINQLKVAFEKVQDPTDWRNPIDALVTDVDLDITLQAIEFYTATKAKVERVCAFGEANRVRSPGYRNGPAGP